MAAELSRSHAKGISLFLDPGHDFPLPVERDERVGLVEVNHRVELLGQAGVEIVAEAFGVRAVDDADRALRAWVAELRGRSPASRMRSRKFGTPTSWKSYS